MSHWPPHSSAAVRTFPVIPILHASTHIHIKHFLYCHLPKINLCNNNIPSSNIKTWCLANPNTMNSSSLRIIWELRQQFTANAHSSLHYLRESDGLWLQTHMPSVCTTHVALAQCWWSTKTPVTFPSVSLHFTRWSKACCCIIRGVWV